VIGVAAGTVAATLGTLGWGTYYCNAPLFGSVIGHGPTDRRELYLTFDDGPNTSATGAILDTIEREQVPAAFFMVGAHVRQFPELARLVAEAGQEIGNHTDHHRKLQWCGPGEIASELAGAHRTIEEITGRPPRTFRAPHGFRNPFVRTGTRRLGYWVIGWTFGVWDSNPIGAEVIRSRVRVRLRPGAIILLHDGDGYDPRGDRQPTAAALPGIIRDARDQGYTFRPLGALLP
jgi:peptidoglycan/xylan/chitin deacetylase (PgdA/CDA1 family)